MTFSSNSFARLKPERPVTRTFHYAVKESKMKTFLVTRLEVYEQLVSVTAENEEEAQRKVKDGHGEIHNDAEFQRFLGDCQDWTVEEEEV
jgi:dTDP-4-dehydrorhamnose 3,5-epimerase-like enzyme